RPNGITDISATQNSSLNSPTGVASVANVFFTALANSTATATVSLTVRYLFDAQGNPMPVSSAPMCAVSVIGPTTSTTSTSTTSTTRPSTTSTSTTSTTRPSTSPTSSTTSTTA